METLRLLLLGIDIDIDNIGGKVNSPPTLNFINR
jgi:hypothetical protein